MTESDNKVDSDEEINEKNFTGKLSFYMMNDQARQEYDNLNDVYVD